MLCAPTSPSLPESRLTTLLSGPVRSSCFCPPWVRRPQGWLCPWQPGLMVSTNCPTSPPPGLSSSQSLAVLLSRCSVHGHQPPHLQSPAPHCPPGPPRASLSCYLDPLSATGPLHKQLLCPCLLGLHFPQVLRARAAVSEGSAASRLAQAPRLPTSCWPAMSWCRCPPPGSLLGQPLASWARHTGFMVHARRCLLSVGPIPETSACPG